MQADDPEIVFDFFKTISCANDDYLCDFHRVNYSDGNKGYKVILKSPNEKEVVADLLYTERKGWHIVSSTAELSAGIQEKLVAAVNESR